MSAPTLRLSREQTRCFYKHHRFLFENTINIDSIFGTPLELILKGSFTIPDLDEAKTWLDLRVRDPSGKRIVGTFYKEFVEPAFWKTYQEGNYFHVLEVNPPPRDVYRLTYPHLYRLTAAGGIEWCNHYDLACTILDQSSEYRGCKLATFLINPWVAEDKKVIEMAAMIPEHIREKIKKEAPYLEMRDFVARVVEAQRQQMMEKFKSNVQKVPGLIIRTTADSDRVYIEWKRTWEEDYLLVCGYHQKDTLDGIETSHNRIVESSTMEDRTEYRLSPEATHYFSFRVIGRRPPGFFESSTDNHLTVQSKALTFSVLGPERVDPLAQAKQAAEIAQWEKRLHEHRASAQSKVEQQRQQAHEVLEGGFQKIDSVSKAMQRMYALRREVEESDLPDDMKNAQLELIDQIAYDVTQRLRAQ